MNNKKAPAQALARVMGVAIVCVVAGAAVAAPTTSSHGFATDMTADFQPVDSIQKGQFGVETIHWVRWSGVTPNQPIKYTCKVFAPGETDPVFENESDGGSPTTEATSFCAYTPVSGFPSGTWRFVNTLNGVKSEGEIEIVAPSLIERVGKWKIIAAILALVALAYFKLRAKD